MPCFGCHGLRLRLHIAIFAIKDETLATFKRVFHPKTRFGTFIFRAVFTSGFAKRIVKLLCVNALTGKLRSHDVYCMVLTRSAHSLFTHSFLSDVIASRTLSLTTHIQMFLHM